MRLSRLLFATLREAPKEAETASHRLMLRASLVRQVAAGIYEWLPLGWRVARKVAAIVREEMDRAGAQEVLLPQLMPKEWWEETGRWGAYGKELMRITDRHERQYALGPTHEEAVTDMVRATARTYRKLPVTLYQIQTKFRDEIRPRFGVMRAREFTMKDAYSFDANDAGAAASYEAMRKAYVAIFDRIGLEYRMVDADSGLIGGTSSQEFMVLAKSGEAEIAVCDGCDYAANLEKAEPGAPGKAGPAAAPAFERVDTPNTKSAKAVAKLLGKDPSEVSKMMFYRAGDRLVAAMVRGDHEIHEVKLARAVGADEVFLASPDEVVAKTGLPLGFMGPVGMKDVTLVADRDLMAMPAIVTGANEKDAHLVNVVPGRDFTPATVASIRSVKAGDRCPSCGGTLSLIRGIEVGHIFRLGTKYSQAMGCVFLDEAGKEREAIMGCYGIGVTRIVAAAIEEAHDEKGIVWPEPIAPWQVLVLPLGAEPEITKAAEGLYESLTAAGLETMIDDREETPGVKFADADLMGMPWQVIVGKTFLKEGLVELKRRGSKESDRVPPSEVASRFAAFRQGAAE